jgi:hypothetical protein
MLKRRHRGAPDAPDGTRLSIGWALAGTRVRSAG